MGPYYYDEGLSTYFSSPAINLSGTRQGSRIHVSGVRIVAGGWPHMDIEAEDFYFAPVAIGSGGVRGTASVTCVDVDILGSVSVGGTGSVAANVAISDSRIAGDIIVGGTGDAKVQLQLHRNRIESGLHASSNTGHFRANIFATNNVFVDHSDREMTAISTGGISSSYVTGLFINNTIVGFDTGLNIGSRSSVDFYNMLIACEQNVFDITGGNISSSLVAGGGASFSGGNFFDIPRLGENQELLPGSPGIDRGNSAVYSLPLTDILGRPRRLDGDGNGSTIVDVGAYEFFVPEPGTLCLVGYLIAWTCIGSRSRRRTWRM
jgi:hypothetical protein